MRILQINVVYKVGSTGKIVNEIHNQLLKSGQESFVIYGRGKTTSESNVYKTSPNWEGKLQALYGRLTGDFYGGAFYSTYKLINKIKTIAPEVVHLHLMNGNYINNYRLLSFLAENNYKTVITLHAEITYTGICEHAFDCERWKTGCGNCPQVHKKYKSLFFDRTAMEWQKKAKAFERFSSLTIVSVSAWLENRAKQSPMFKNRDFYVVGNGVDTTIYKPVNTATLKERLGLKNEKVILHVTPSFKSIVKGGEHVVELAKRFQKENVIIIIVGYDGFKEKLPSNIIPISHTTSQEELAEFYSLANITLLTSKLETFSMVCAESLSCGTPVVGFKAGAPEQIAIAAYSEFVTNGNIDALEQSVRTWLAKDIDCYDVIQRVNNKYSILNMIKGYKKIYEKI
ncbi:glycosyltransferase [Flavobacterium sp. N2820]|uniref:glycosyltransferase n=1 Tax=Flavobacterium sp. N2820 TaxID=2986834 RepID=UPI002224621E|nr:glycosyltransferase [Flavobacterium sp. N2820]